VQQQVELQIHSNEILAISCEAVPLNCSNQAAQTKWLEKVTATVSCFFTLLVKTQINLMFKKKLQFTRGALKKIYNFSFCYKAARSAARSTF